MDEGRMQTITYSVKTEACSFNILSYKAQMSLQQRHLQEVSFGVVKVLVSCWQFCLFVVCWFVGSLVRWFVGLLKEVGFGVVKVLVRFVVCWLVSQFWSCESLVVCSFIRSLVGFVGQLHQSGVVKVLVMSCWQFCWFVLGLLVSFFDVLFVGLLVCWFVDLPVCQFVHLFVG